jgi:hypothetical protein
MRLESSKLGPAAIRGFVSAVLLPYSGCWMAGRRGVVLADLPGMAQPSLGSWVAQ